MDKPNEPPKPRAPTTAKAPQFAVLHAWLGTKPYPSSDAEHWLQTLAKKCPCIRQDNLPAADQFCIKQHGLLPYLLLARAHPAVVVTSGSELKQALAALERTNPSDLSRLTQDAFLFFLTDEEGTKYSQRSRPIFALPWAEQCQLLAIERIELFNNTSVLKGFSQRSYQLRKRILASVEDKIEPEQNKVLRRPVLILGKSGSGKEYVAKALCQAARLSEGDFEAVACGMLSETLLNDQLFGHWEGAFSGAISNEPGVLELHSDGAVLLDDLDAAQNTFVVQGALLRFASTTPPMVKRLGHPPIIQGSKPPRREKDPKEVYTWLLVSTNKNPREMVDKHTFREDFLFRFKRVLNVAPLAARRSDIPFIALELTKDLSRVRPLDVPALRWLRDRQSDWAGNARELDALLLCAADLLREDSSLTWTHACEAVASRGTDYLKWFEDTDELEDIETDAWRPNDMTTLLRQAAEELEEAKQQVPQATLAAERATPSNVYVGVKPSTFAAIMTELARSINWGAADDGSNEVPRPWLELCKLTDNRSLNSRYRPVVLALLSNLLINEIPGSNTRTVAGSPLSKAELLTTLETYLDNLQLKGVGTAKKSRVATILNLVVLLYLFVRYCVSGPTHATSRKDIGRIQPCTSQEWSGHIQNILANFMDGLLVQKTQGSHGAVTIQLKANMLDTIWAQFKITDEVFSSLRAAGVPDYSLSKLTPLKDEEFDRERLLGKLKERLDQNELVSFRDLIVNHAHIWEKD
jgi:DNA-binding NtrC family response regulator